MEHVNNKVLQASSQYIGVVSWLKTWKVHVNKEVKGTTPIPFIPRGTCEGVVEPRLWDVRLPIMT
jgi:hypothetical protein